MDSTTKRCPSVAAMNELLAAREGTEREAGESSSGDQGGAVEEIARLACLEPQKKLTRGEKSPVPSPPAASEREGEGASELPLQCEIPMTPSDPSEMEFEKELASPRRPRR